MEIAGVALVIALCTRHMNTIQLVKIYSMLEILMFKLFEFKLVRDSTLLNQFLACFRWV